MGRSGKTTGLPCPAPYPCTEALIPYRRAWIKFREARPPDKASPGILEQLERGPPEQQVTRCGWC